MTSAPKAPKTGPETASYLLNGPEQNTTQGVAMPLIYGRFRVGSSVVSTRLSATQIAVGSLNFKTQTLGSRGRTIPPATPANVALPGMLPPDVPDITGALAWQYPYPYYD